MILTPARAAHLLDARAKSLPSAAYKLAASTYGLDVGIQTTLECDEKEMSVVIPFADGSQRDGVGDLLEVGGIRLDRHRKNPLVLFDHGKQVSLPIGMALERGDQGKYDISRYTVVLDQAAQRATLKAYLYQGKGLAGLDKQRDYDHSVFTEQVFDMACKGLLRGGSIGYQVIHAKELYPDYETGVPKGLHLLSVLMLEGSLVVLPANADTVAKMLSLPECCGKPLSPYLIKSLAPYAPTKKAQLGYEAKSIALWKYNKTTGYWNRQRDCDDSTAQQWLERFQKDEPNDYFVLSNRKPNKDPRGKALESKGLLPGVDTQHYHNIPPVQWKPGLGALKALKMKYGKKQAMRPEEEKYRSLETGDAVKSLIPGDLSFWREEQQEAEHKKKIKALRSKYKGFGQTPSASSLRNYQVGDTVFARSVLTTLEGGKTVPFARTGDRLEITGREGPQWMVTNPRGQYAYVGSSEIRKSLGVGVKTHESVIKSRVWERVRQGGFLSVNDLQRKLQIDTGLIQTALDQLVNEGKAELVSEKPGAPKLYSYKALPLEEVRRKYRAAKGLRRRLRKSSPGTSTLRVREKDLKECQGMAEARGLKFAHLGGGKVKLIGDDAGVDEVAKHFAVRGL